MASIMKNLSIFAISDRDLRGGIFELSLKLSFGRYAWKDISFSNFL